MEHGTKVEQSSGSHPSTTNNRMELTAAIESLLLVAPRSSAQIFTTSDYLFQGITRWVHGWRKNGWQKKDGKPVANADLWQALDQLTSEYAVRWFNAKGQQHAALDEAGKLAVSAIDIA